MKLGILALASAASVALVVGCASPSSEEAESSTQDLVGLTSAYTKTSDKASLDQCTVTAEPAAGRGRRYDCGTMGEFTLVADQHADGTKAYVRTPTGTYDLYLGESIEHQFPGSTKNGYFGQLAEWRGTGVALGKVRPKALIMRYFYFERDSAGAFHDRNVLVVAKVSTYEACVAGVVSGATPNHNQLARDIVDSPEFEMGDCGEMVPEPLAPTGCGALAPYTGLLPDQSVSSCSGSHSLIMQTDGNLVLYNNKTGRATWNSKTVSGAANHWAAMDERGRFSVLEPATLGAPFMTPNPASEGASLAIQDDGNLVVYSTKGEPLWASNTHGK